MRECNWLQALEGDIDTVHAAFLHGGQYVPEDFPEGTFNYYEANQRYARFVAVDTEFGCMYGAARPAGEGRNYWRIGQFMFPIWTQPPPGLLGHKILTTCWVPLDDYHTLSYTLMVPSHSAYGPAGGQRVSPSQQPAAPNQQGAPNQQAMFLPATTDWFGRFRTAANSSNDFMMDRQAQRDMVKYAGVANIMAEDHAVQASMGPILDRTIEHLGTSDMMIIRVRRRLLEAAQAWLEKRVPPPALDNPEIYAIRCGGTYLPVDTDWLEGIKEFTRAFVEHPELDVAVVGGTKYLPLAKRSAT